MSRTDMLKFAANYPAFVKLAPIRLWLRAYEFTPYTPCDPGQMPEVSCMTEG